MIEISKLMSWRCPKCGMWQNRGLSNLDKVNTDYEIIKYLKKVSLRCVFCNKTRRLKKVREYGLSVDHKFHNDMNDAIRFVISQNQK